MMTLFSLPAIMRSGSAKTARTASVFFLAAAIAAGVAPQRAAAQMVGPAVMPHAQIYPAVDAAQADIRSALAEARRTHRRVLLDFGGDWCGDCQMLNYWFHQAPNADLLAKHYVLVDINIGHIDQNLEIGEKYGVALKKGVPELAVLRPDGSVVFAQKGEFEDFRHNNPSDLTAFLEKWKN